MRNDKIVPGVILIMIGTLILLHNYGYVSFHILNLVYIIPILIVLVGLNLIFGHNRKSPWAIGVKLAVVAAGFALVLFGNLGKRHGFWNNHSYDINIDGDDDDDNDHGSSITKVEGNSEYTTPFAADAKIARLNISGGGAIYTLSDTTSQLFTATTREFKGRYIYTHTQHDSVYVLDFKTHGSRALKFHFDDDNDKHDSSKTNSAVFKLNTNPEWEINVKTGAAKLDFDLSKFKVRSLDLAGGAAAFEVKLGQPLSVTNVTVETGMSDVNISVPANAACRIKSSTGLSSTSFDGFDKKDNGIYETPGFSTAKNKLYIKMSGGMASFKVKRY
jgi:hypothetical protein